MAYRRHRPEFLWTVQFIQNGDCSHSEQRLAGGREVN